MRERPDGMLEAETFEEHMMPGVTWHDDPAYAAAFADIIGETIMTDCAAFTKPSGSYPGYVNVQRDHTGAFILTVRADPTLPWKGEEASATCGETAVVTIPEDEWNQLVVNANRLPVPKEDDNAEAPASGGAAAGDPLAQRADAPDEGGGAEPVGNAGAEDSA